MSTSAELKAREEAFNAMFAHMEAVAGLYASFEGIEDAKAGKNLGDYLKEKREEIKVRVMS